MTLSHPLYGHSSQILMRCASKEAEMAIYHDPGLSIDNFYKISREGKAWDTCCPRNLIMSLKFSRI